MSRGEGEGINGEGEKRKEKGRVERREEVD